MRTTMTAEVHRTALLLSGARVGPKKRLYSAAPAATPTAMQWLDVWEKKGCEGGMLAEQVERKKA